MYGKGLIHVAVEKFVKWATWLPGTIIGKDAIKQKVWIVPALIYTVRYVNDTIQSPGDSTLQTRRLNH